MVSADAIDEQTSLIIRREIKASAKAVFQALIDPTAIRQWFGPSDDFAVLAVDADPRVGGRYQFTLRSPDGVEHKVGGVYRDIVPDRRLVFSWAWASTPERQSEVSIQLAEKGGITVLTLSHVRFADKAARDRHEHGWVGTIERLDRYMMRNAG